MSPSNRNRTLSFVTFAALVALTGCSSEASSFGQRATAAPIDGAHVEIAGVDATTLPVSLAVDATSLPMGFQPGALRLGATPVLVVGTDACETDADCVPDGCHATSCVAAAEMAPGELECTAQLRYGTTDGGGCLCHVGHCAARLSTPPEGI
ncbi:MAG: hypothetical protein J0L92_14650 [Deltaproteobacteria bacterium]|nr:hypothetical protein [Deltaproteobacteria bacterium]